MFSPDYFTARDRFRGAADRLGWPREAHPVAARGPAGEELTLDVAASPGAAGDPVLFVTSGVHGVEGFFGSAVQLAAMDMWSRDGPPAGVRVVLLHAVSPWAFAHLRRFDEQNADPNRNFLPAGEEYRGSPPMYPRLDPLLNPRSPPGRWDDFTPRALVAIARWGFAPLKQAVAGGQYDFPKGLFYGGAGLSEGPRVVADRLPGWLRDAREVVHLDFHTGLGGWGTYKLLIDPPLTAVQLDRAHRWFGRDVLQVADVTGVAYQTRGGFGPWCAQANPHRDYLFLCAEFGTYGNLAVVGGLRAENRAHHWGHPSDPGTRRAKDRLRELFGPADSEWRRATVDRGVRLIHQAQEGLRGA